MSAMNKFPKPVKALFKMRHAGREYWFWAGLLVTALALGVAGVFVKESINVWNQPRVIAVQGGLDKTDVQEKEFAQAAAILQGLIPRNDTGVPVLLVVSSATGITITGASLGSYEAFMTALWQMPGMIPNATWDFEELCLGAGCSNGVLVAKVKAKHIKISIKRN